MAKNNQITTQIIITCNAKNADDEIKRIQATVTELDNKIAKMRKDGADEKDIKFVENLRNSMNNFSRETVTGFERIKAAIEKLDEQSVNQLRRARRAAQQYRDSLSANDTEYAEAEENLKKINTQIDLLTGKQRRLSDATKNFNGTLQNISTASIDKLNEALKDGEVMLNRMSKGEVECAGVVPGMANIRQEIANRRQMTAMQTQSYLYQPFQGGRTWADLTQQQVTDRLAVAKESLKNMSLNDSNRGKLTEYIRQAETQLQKLNGTFVNTDELIHRTFGNADASPKELTEAINLVKQKLDSLPASMTADREKYNQMMADMIQRSKKLRGELVNSGDGFKRIRELVGQTGDEMKKAGEKAEDFPKRLRDLKTVPFDKLREAAKLMRTELAKMSESDANFKTMQKNVEKVEAQLEKSTAAVNKHGSAWKTTIKNMFAYVGVFGMLNMVKSKIEEIISLNLKFSQQLADVRKVSGLASSDIKQLGNELAKIDSRTSLQGLMNTAYSGAKLGFGEQGVEGLAQFTRAANVAAVSIGEELGEDALPVLSKIVENMGIIKKYGIEQSMLKTASAMFKLSSTSTATSNNIVEFSKRLTAMSKVAGITTDQLLALGSASDAMYLSPEVAATAFTKLISSVQTSHNLIEKTLGMTKGTINDLFSKGKAMDAIVQIFEKMHDLGNMNALKPVFKDLGSDGTRLMNVMTAMAKNVDVLKKHLDTSAEAFREGTAATAEYNIQQETAEGLMERAKNLWQKAVMNPKDVDLVHEFAEAWYDVTASLTGSKAATGVLQFTMGVLLNTMQMFLSILPGLLTFILSRGLVYGFSQLAKTLALTAESANAATWSFKAMWKAAKWNWITLGIGLITELCIWISNWKQNLDDVAASQRTLNGSIKEANQIAQISIDRAKDLAERIKTAAEKSNERNSLIRTFNKEFGQYYKNLLTEESSAYAVAKAYEEVCKQLQAKALLEAKDKLMEKEVNPRTMWSVMRLQEYGEWAEKAKSPYDSEYAKKFYEERVSRGMSLANIIRQFNQQVTKSKDKFMVNRIINPVGDDMLHPEFFTYTRNKEKGTAEYHPELRQLFHFAAFIRQEQAKNNKIKDINKAFEPFKDEISQYIISTTSTGPDENPGTLDNDATDKAALSAAKSAERERKKLENKHKKQLQDDLKAADGQVKSFTKAIDAYYTLQEKAIQELYMQGKMNEAEMNRYVTLMQSKRDIIAAQGRFAIVGDENNFDELRKQMGANFDQFDYSAESNKLLGIIQKADPTATGKLIRNLEGALGTTPDNSIMNDIRNTGVNAQKSESDRRLKIFESADSYLNSKNYIVNAGREYDTILSQSGLTDVGLERGSTIAAGKELPSRTKVVKNPETGKEEPIVMGEPTATMRQDFIKEGVSHYNVDVSDADQLRKWLDRFVSQSGKGVLQRDALGTEYVNDSDKKDWSNYIPGLQDMLFGIGKDADEKIKILFSTLMQYEEKYYEAKKQQLDYETKILESRWTRSDDYKQGQEKERELEVKSHIQGIYGRGETGAFLNTQEMARNNGFADNIEGDPEVEKVKLHMELARKEADLAKQTSDDKELIRQKDKAAQDAELAYADKINQQIKARIDLLQQWVDPLQEFSEAMGDAFVKMTESAEEGRDAMKEATQNMVKTFAKMTIDMIAQQLKMEVQRALFHKKMLSSETDYQKGMKDANEQGHKSIFKALGSFFKKRKKDKSKAATDENKQEKDTAKKGTDIVKDAASTELKTKTEVATKGAEITQQMDQKSSEAKVETAATDAQTTGAETQGNIFAGIASGAAKIIGKLGWWGIPLIAVIQGLLMGLLNSALGKLFGGKQKSSANTNTKLVSGMLTYDSGNVEAFSGAIDKKTYPVVGNDGKVYAAKPTDKLVTGLLTEPVATTVNGVPSLIAERGPEMIIGRETTQALMMARPDIISEIVRFDRNHSGKAYRAYDSGNIAEVVSNLSTPSVSTSQQQVTQADFADFVSTMRAMAPIMQAFTRQLQQPLKTSINMYGNGGLYDSMSRASKFMSGRG